MDVGERIENIDQWSRIESPEIDSHKYSELIFNKGLRPVRQSFFFFFFQQMVLEQLEHPPRKKLI